MTKLIYPHNGLYNYIGGDISGCSINILNALNNCNFQIPSGFTYTNFINSLYSTVDSYRKEIDDIKAKIKYTDTKLENLDESMQQNINPAPSSIIEETNSLIKF